MTMSAYIRRIQKFILRFSARNRLPWLAAGLLAVSSSTIHCGKKSNKRYRVLALSVNKPGVLHDVEETFLRADDFEVIRWPDFTLSVLADAILAPSLNNNSYQTEEPSAEKTKVEYRGFLIGLWKCLSLFKTIHAAVAPNYGYYVQREFAAALEQCGTPFIVIHKENLKSSGRLEYWRAVYKNLRGKFTGRKILVYNDTERDLQLSCGVTTAEKIAVTGMPRLDRLHNWRRRKSILAAGPEQDQVVFFAFDRRDKLPMSLTKRPAKVENQWGELSWGTLCEKTHLAMVDIARRRPDVKVIIKTKPNSRHQTEIAEMLAPDGAQLPENLEIATGGDPFDLLTKCKVVVGFNTTAQLEAMAAGIPVVTPWFDEAIDPRTSEFVIDLDNSVDYARSPEELAQLVYRFIDAPRVLNRELSPSVRRALSQWTGNDDGGAGHRVLDVVRHEIERAKS